MCSETEIAREGDRKKPELRGVIVAIDMDVRWLVGLMAVKVEAIGTFAKDGRHPSDCSADGPRKIH